jgi:secreted trypsin-like serine protease
VPERLFWGKFTTSNRFDLAKKVRGNSDMTVIEGLPARAAAFCLYAALVAAGTIAPARAMVGGAAPAAGGAGRSVVMILGSYGTACTATAIARDLLLTAAHCVQPGADYKLADLWSAPKPQLKDITRTERDPQFDLKRLLGHLATADVAVVKLAQPLPDKIPPASLDDATAPPAAGDSFVVAGYGVTVRGDGRTGGTVRAATLIATGTPNTLQLRLFDPRTRGESAGLGACAGDSGAPTFRDRNGTLAIVGVVSWSTGPKLTGGCGGLTGITPLIRYRSWIIGAARALGSPLPAQRP